MGAPAGIVDDMYSTSSFVDLVFHVLTKFGPPSGGASSLPLRSGMWHSAQCSTNSGRTFVSKNAASSGETAASGPADQAAAATATTRAGSDRHARPDRGHRRWVGPLIMDAGWNGGSLIARANKNWRNLAIDKLDGSIAFDGKVVRTGNSGDVLGHPLNALAWLANKLGEHGKTLKKGMIVSSGSMVACQFVPPGSTAVGRIDGLGEVTLKYELPK